MLSVPFAVIPCLCILSSLPGETVAPLRVVAVVRQGLPPFETDERLYRLEGKASSLLKVGEKLVLQRAGEKSSPGKLKVLEVHGEFALAALDDVGETYPLKGDLALRIEPPDPLPPLPIQRPEDVSSRPLSVKVMKPVRELPKEQFKGMPQVLSSPAAPVVVTAAPDVVPVAARRQPIFFLKSSASLSPGAFEKLKSSVASWGLRDHWVLGYPGSAGFPPVLQQDRLATLRAELRRLGVETLEVRLLPPEAQAKYDVIYVICESR